MPNSMRWLCLTHCLCWMSLLCFSLYFTDFIGEEVFGMFFFYKQYFIYMSIITADTF